MAALIRRILVLALIAVLGIFVVSNNTPIALVFLGLTLPALPLGIWILGAIGAGVVTELVTFGLFQLTHRAGKRRGRSQMRRSFSGGSFQPGPTGSSGGDATRTYNQNYRAEQDEDAAWKNWEGYETPVDRSSAATAAAREAAKPEPIDDWNRRNYSDDWDDFAGQGTPRDRPPTSAEQQTRIADERPSEPKTAARSGSTYSYGYRAPQNTGVSRTESVVDADYRVIVPPYTPNPVEPTPEIAEDWFDDDDLETDEERQRRLGL
jgi:uncharacterized integral membrane protein